MNNAEKISSLLNWIDQVFPSIETYDIYDGKPIDEGQKQKLKNFLPTFKKIKNDVFNLFSIEDEDQQLLELNEIQKIYDINSNAIHRILTEKMDKISEDFLEKIKKMKPLDTSPEGFFCGTHALGHSIYLHWDKITLKSKDNVLKAFNEFYETDFNCASLKRMLDTLSNRDVQWVLSQSLDNIIKNEGFKDKTENFYYTTLLLELAKRLDIPVEFLVNNCNFGFRKTEQKSPVIAIKLDNYHYESLVDEEIYTKIMAKSVKNQFSVRDKKTVQDFLSNLVNEEALRENIQNLQYEIEKRLNSTRVISPEKKAFYEATKAQLEKMLESLKELPSITDLLKFEKELKDLSSHKFLENDKSFYALLKKILEFICKVIDWLSVQAIDTYEYFKSSISSFSAG